MLAEGVFIMRLVGGCRILGKNWRQVVLKSFAIFAFVGAIPIKALADVDTSGHYTNRIPIAVPSFHGITPQVALVYSSGGGGYAGAGWELFAGSVITRRSHTKGIPLFDAEDIFFLNDDELVPCVQGSVSPSCSTAQTAYNTVSGFFSTRIESFERIRFEAGIWTVWSKDGTRRTYVSGNGGFSYQLRTITDTYDNKVVYAWSCASSVVVPCYLDSISYGDSGGALGAEIRFYRESRPDPHRMATGRGSIWYDKRLRTIAVRFNGQLVRSYGLHYGSSKVSGASILTSVQPYGRDDSVDADGLITALPPLLPAMSFASDSLAQGAAWQLAAQTSSPYVFDIGAGPSVSAIYARPSVHDPARLATELYVEVGPSMTPDGESADSGTVVGDFDGDGRAEVLAWGISGLEDNRGVLNVEGQLNIATGPGPRVSASLTSGKSLAGCYRAIVWAADIDGDGIDDVIAMFSCTNLASHQTWGQLVVGLGQSNGTLVDGPAITSRTRLRWPVSNRGCLPTDVNGDGKQDLVCEDYIARVIRTYILQNSIWVETEVRTDSGAHTGTREPHLPDHRGLRIRGGDVDGDGLDDIVLALPFSGAKTRVILGHSKGDGSYTWSEEQIFAVDISDARRNFHLTDIDGDGRLDLAFTRTSKIDYALARKGHVNARWISQPTLDSEMKDIQFVDLDGDGRADLLDTLQLRVQLANPNGGFLPAPATTPCVYNPRTAPVATVAAADLNGDGLADPLCVTGLGGEFLVVDQPSQSKGTDRHRWKRADLDGDGQPEWIYVQYTNPGYDIYIVSPVTQARTKFQLRPNSQTGPLLEPDGARWIFADFGSSSGPADGKVDLVLVENEGGNLKTTTLLSTGLGTFNVHTQMAWAGYPDNSTKGWFAAKLGRALRAELVRLRPLSASDPGVTVDMLRMDTPGNWSTFSQSFFQDGSSAPILDRSVGRFMPTDVNGDGLTDLVHMEIPLSADATIRTLRADGYGGFSEVVSTILLSSVNGRRWRIGELDGDGVPDLVHVQGSPNPGVPCLRFNTLNGNGLGGFNLGRTDTACIPTIANDPLYERLFEDSVNVVFIDLDRDGANEIVHTTHALDAAGELRLIVTRFKRDMSAQIGQWSAATPDLISTPYDHGDAWSWNGYRNSMTGAAGLEYVHSNVALSLDWAGPSDEMTFINNGMGLNTNISYGPYRNSRVYLPAGYIPRIVTRVITRDDAHSTNEPASIDNVDYAFNDARWSDQKDRLAGFGTMVVSNGRSRNYQHFDIDDACGTRLSRVETRGPSGGELWSATDYQPLAAGSTPPFTCLTKVVLLNECELGSTCRVAQRIEKTYDAYGNTDAIRSDIDQAVTTLILSPVEFINPTAYIVDRPTQRMTVESTPTGLKRTGWSRFYYDGQASVGFPLAHGELTGVGELDDQNQNWLERSYSYHTNGVLINKLSAGGKKTTIILDPTYQRFPEQVCNGLHCILQEWDFGLGKVKKITEPSGTFQQTSYDAYGRITRVDRSGGGFTRTSYLDTGNTSSSYDHRQRIRTEVSDGSVGDGVLWSEAFFDGSGRIYRTSREGGATETKTYADSSSQPQRVSMVHPSNVDPSKWTKFEYDGLGRTTLVTRPDTTTVQTIFSLGQVEHRNENNETTIRRFDGAGKVVELIEPMGATTRYQYDPLGRLTTITDAKGYKNTFTWNSLGRLTASTDPDRGLRTFKYYPDGELNFMDDAKGQKIIWSYDMDGRPRSRKDRDAAGVVTRQITWTYDEANTPNPHGASLGRLVRIDDNQEMTGKTVYASEFWYDAVGQVTRNRTCIDATCMDQDTEYDLAGRVSAHIYPNSRGSTKDHAGAERVEYEYHSDGLIFKVGDYARFSWELDGLPSRVLYGNGVKSVYSYGSERRWLESVDIGGQLTINYPQHDPVGRIISQIVTGYQNTDLEYFYDDLGRLKEVNSTDPSRRENFNYDVIGRLSYSKALGDVKYADNKHVHAATSSDLYQVKREYDTNGNTLFLKDPSGRDLELQWTVDDRLENAKDIATGSAWVYGYDLAGRRIKKEGPSGTWRSFGPRLALDENGNLVKYYFAGDLLLAANNDGTVSYFHSDAAHAVRLVTDRAGNAVAGYEFSAYGQPLNAISKPPGENEFGYSSSRSDASLGLVAMGARTYDPVLGQFLSADNVIPDTFRPQSLNRYRYVENDPINHWDPTGHMKASVELKKARHAETTQEYERMREAENRICSSPLVDGCFKTGIDFGFNKAGQLVLLVSRGAWFLPPPESSSLDLLGVLSSIFGGGGLEGGRGGGRLNPASVMAEMILSQHTDAAKENEGDKGTELNHKLISCLSGDCGIILGGAEAAVSLLEKDPRAFLLGKLLEVGFLLGTNLFEASEEVHRRLWEYPITRFVFEQSILSGGGIAAYRYAPDSMAQLSYDIFLRESPPVYGYCEVKERQVYRPFTEGSKY